MDDPIAIYDEWLSGRRHRMPNGFWQIRPNARAVLEEVWRRVGVTPETAPHVCRYDWFQRHRLSGLLAKYRHSPYYLLTTLYPGRYSPTQFPEFPKASDLQTDAFHAVGLERPENPHRRAYEATRVRADATGRCRKCGKPRLPDSVYCAEHRQWAREWGRRLRAAGYLRRVQREQRAAGLCEYARCTLPPVPGKRRCEKHLAQARRYWHRYKIKRKRK